MAVLVRQKVKGGPWWVFVNHQGRRKTKCVGDKQTAEVVGKEVRKRIAEGAFDLTKREAPTFGRYTEQYLEGYVETKCKFSTGESYTSCLKKHILPVFGTQKLNEITRAGVKDFMFQKAKTLEPGTVKNLVSLISGILTNAVEDGLIQENPAARTGKFLPKKDRKGDINPFTKKESQIFLEAVQKHQPGFYPLFLCALRTGLRLGELLALQWGDLDFQGQFIEVRRNLQRNRQVTTPKNHQLRRVDMSKQLAEVLKNLKTQRKAEALKKGWGELPPWLFINQYGEPLDRDNLRRRVFLKILEKAGLRHTRLHDLRHTYASLLIQQRAPLAYVKNQLGHSSIQITVDTYGHLEPGADRAEVDKLDDAPTCTLSAPNTKKGVTANL